MVVVSEYQEVFKTLRANRWRVANTSADERIRKLVKLKNYLLDHQEEAYTATRLDFGKPTAETIIGEYLILTSELSYAIKNLKKWLKPERQVTPLTMIGTSSYIQYEAKGCVLIIAPWNYPIALSLKPLISAISAGCVAVIKPSEMTPNSSRFVRGVIENVFDPTEIIVVEGDIDTSTELLKLPFDHIFFTGSPQVGKIVMQAAAKNLTSVTLELGGKSPSIVDETADIKSTARLLMWGKFFNNGQTCIAPDYVFVQENVAHRLLEEMKMALQDMYKTEGGSVESSTSYGRIVSQKHFNRLIEMLKDATENGAIVEEGGLTDSNMRFFSPTLLTKVDAELRVMQEEIFGPILPIIPYKKLDDAVDFINAREKPLALYIHSKNKTNTDFILHHTSAGNCSVNELLTQFGNAENPFGGVNHSGIGKSNGFYGFKEFSNAKGVMKRRFGTMKFLYPPYSNKLVDLLKKGLKWI